MIVGFHLIAFLVNEYLMPAWQKNMRETALKVVGAMHDAETYM